MNILYSDGSVENIDSNNITGISVEDYYENSRLPIFRLSLIMEYNTIFKIIKDKNDILFQIRLQKYHCRVGTKHKSLVSDVFNKTFGIYIDETPEDLQRKIKRMSGNKSDTKKLDKMTNSMDIYLFDCDIVNGLLKSSNMIINNIDINTLVSYLLYQANCKKILMSPVDNRNIYDTIILPPQSIYENIKYLDAYYGFYKTGMLLYFGLDRSYMLRYGPYSDAVADNEYHDTTILISEKGSDDTSQNGSIIREGESTNYIAASNATVQFINNIVALDVITGTDATIIDASNNKLDTFKSNYETRGDGKYSYIYNDTMNDYRVDTYSQQVKGQECQLNFAVSDYDIAAVTPNKNINIVFEDLTLNDKYNGVYKTASAVHKFVHDSTSDFTLASVITFKKQK
jgi:hypothetical protein